MSFLYDPRTKRPQIWTYPIFILLAAGIFLGFYLYGEKKAAERAVIERNVEPERTY